RSPLRRSSSPRRRWASTPRGRPERSVGPSAPRSTGASTGGVRRSEPRDARSSSSVPAPKRAPPSASTRCATTISNRSPSPPTTPRHAASHGPTSKSSSPRSAISRRPRRSPADGAPLMEYRDVVRRRRMVRSFTDEPVDPQLLDQLLADALRAPSAGNSQGRDLVVLEGPEQTARFWDITLPAPRRERFAWPGLLRAPVLVLPFADPDRYVARYAEPDKARTGLGEGDEAWPVPYWTVDTAFVVMSLLHGVVDAGLGALFFGIFRG